MSTIGVRELARNASAIINELDETKEPAMITRRGRPVAYMLPVDSAQFEDFVLANAPEFVSQRLAGPGLASDHSMACDGSLLTSSGFRATRPSSIDNELVVIGARVKDA